MDLKLSAAKVEQVRKAEPVPEPPAKEVVPMIKGNLAGIPSYGLQLLPEKLLALFEKELLFLQEQHNAKVFSIVFKQEEAVDEENETILGCWIPETCSIALYIDSAIDITKDKVTAPEGADTSVGMTLWLSLLLGLAHEAAHSLVMDEDDANKMADEALIHLAQTYDINLPEWDVVNQIIEPMRGIDDPKFTRLVHMHDQGIVWESDGNVIKDVNEFIKLVNLSDEDDDDSTDNSAWYTPLQTATRNTATAKTPEAIVNTGMPDPATILAPDSPEAYPDPNTSYMGMNQYAMEQIPDQPEDWGNPTNDPAASFSTANTTFPNHGLTSEQVNACTHAVLMRLYIHIFTACASNGNEIFNPINISDIPNAMKVFVAMDTNDENGKFIKMAKISENIGSPAGTVKGTLGKNTGIPMYHLYINKGDVTVRASLIMQNPNKTKADGSLSAWAQRAQAGHRIAMLMITEPDGSNKCSLRIETAPGQPLESAYYGKAF